MSVMSQGELNALALSLFLPRMMLAQSPFRFLVIDDPVQAMDANKVDGLDRAGDRSDPRERELAGRGVRVVGYGEQHSAYLFRVGPNAQSLAQANE
jgi:hypothetical protein